MSNFEASKADRNDKKEYSKYNNTIKPIMWDTFNLHIIYNR